MATIGHPKVSYPQAQSLQRELERTLLQLERSGLLREAAGDEVRVIVAEDIAEHFGEHYRTFPSAFRQGGLEIRRDCVPKPCVLQTRMDERVRAAQQQHDAAVGQASSAATSSRSRMAASRPSLKRGAGHAREQNKRVVATTQSSPDKTVVSSNRDTTKRVQNWVSGISNLSSSSTSPEKKDRKTWDAALTTANDPCWEPIFANSSKLSSATTSAAMSVVAVSTRQRNKQDVQAASQASFPAKQAATPMYDTPEVQGALSAFVEEIPSKGKEAAVSTRNKDAGKVEFHISSLANMTPPRKTSSVKIGSVEEDLIDFSP